MNFDDMQWLVTVSTNEPAVTYGPFDRSLAVRERDAHRASGEQAEAWAAQLPDMRVVLTRRITA